MEAILRDPLVDRSSLHSQVLSLMAGPNPQPTREMFLRSTELGIFPTVRAWLQARGADVSISDPGFRRENIAHALRTRVLSDVISKLDDVAFAVLKGIPLARELYGDATMRSSSDIDLLVAPADVSASIALLGELGFVARGEPDVDANREVELVHAEHGLLIDLHWRIAFPWVPAPDATDLLGRRTQIYLDGGRIPVLARPDRLLHLALHFHDHVGFAKGLLDIAAFVDAHGDEVVESIESEAMRLGLGGVMSWPIETLRAAGLQPPAAPKVTRAVTLWATWSARALDGLLLRDTPIGARHPASFKIGEISRGEQVLLKGTTMALLDRRRDRLRAMSQPIVSSPEALARRRGADEVALVDWAKWALRPASLVAKQLQDLARDSGD